MKKWKNKMKTSIILCTRNRLESCLYFSESLINQTEKPDEYIIVDSSDKPMNENKVFSNFSKVMNKKIKTIYIHSAPGLTKQRNIGIKKSTGDVIYFFDDDVFLDKSYIKEMNKIYLKHPEYFGGMGVFTLNLEEQKQKGKFEISLRKFFMLQHSYGDGKFYPSGFPKHQFKTKSLCEVEALSGAIMSFRKEVLKNDKFDEFFKNYCYMEDADISRRISYKYKLFQNPLAKAEHRHAAGGRGNLFENRKMLMFNHMYLFNKNFKKIHKGSRIAHTWSIIGMIFFGVLLHLKNLGKQPNPGRDILKGYFAGIRAYNKYQSEMKE